MCDTSCPDWRERLLAGRPLVPDLPLFDVEAQAALRVFKGLRLPDVTGTPTLGEAAGEWFFAIVAALFGAYDPVTQRRLIQELFLLVPKKNMKSTGAAGIMLTAIVRSRRPQAEGTLIAPTKEVADISYSQAEGMVRLHPKLSRTVHLQRHIRTLTYRPTGASLKIKAADTDVITGSKSTYTLIDETHVFAERSNAAAVFVELRGALAARPDGFMMQITTQSKKPPAGVFRSELATARAVRDGRMQLPLLPVLYELPHDLSKDDGWKDRRYWPLVNPNLGRSVNIEFLDRELQRAEQDGPQQLALLASQHFNVEIGMALQSDRWAGAEHWQKAAETALTLDSLIERSEVIVVGIDGGGLDDLLGLAVIGREKETRHWLSWTHAWAHKSVLERRKTEASRFNDFAVQGDLTIVDEPGQDVTDIGDIVEQIDSSGKLAEKHCIGVDPVGIGQIVDELGARDIDASRIVGIPQGWKLAGAIKTAERGLADGTLVHAGRPMMAWCVGNAKVEPRGNAIAITKQAAGTAKIDPLMAMFNAVALMSMNPPNAGSVYEERGITIWSA